MKKLVYICLVMTLILSGSACSQGFGSTSPSPSKAPSQPTASTVSPEAVPTLKPEISPPVSISTFAPGNSVTPKNTVSGSGQKGLDFSWNLDYATIKYDSQGHQLWISRYNGPGNAFDRAYAIAVDKQGNGYVTGESMGSANGTSYDYATIKYDKDGQQLWINRYHSDKIHQNEGGDGIAVDDIGNVYVTGNYVTIKYDQDGHVQWLVNFPGGPIVVDGLDNIYIAYQPIIKLDKNGKKLSSIGVEGEGPITLKLDKADNLFISTSEFIYKYDVNGKLLWKVSGIAPENPGMGKNFTLDIDSTGNIYVTGKINSGKNNIGYEIAKYDSTGKQLWVSNINIQIGGPYDAAVEALDKQGNVFIAGPSAIVKYDANGNQLWAINYFNHDINFNSLTSNGLATDDFGNVIVSGRSSDNKYLTVKFDTNGKKLWASSYHGPYKGSTISRPDIPHAMTTDEQGNIYVTGESPGNSGLPAMNQSPYPDVKVYEDPSQTIEVNIGDELAFGFEANLHLAQSWNEQHDDTMLSLIDKQGIEVSPPGTAIGKDEKYWYLFKAANAGQTQIVFTFLHQIQETNTQKVFNIIIK